MANVKSAPYGSWRSPITADLISRGTIGLSQPRIHGEAIFWMEMRPSEGGRNVIVKQGQDGRTREINPLDFNARTRVHEYGGGDYAISNEAVYFSNFSDQRLFEQRGETTRPLTAPGAMRYADTLVDSWRQRLICVREDHTGGGEPINTLASVDFSGGNFGEVLVGGYDFYSSPKLSPDGQQLAWLCWNHPNMPWDGCELWLATLDESGRPRNAKCVAGGLQESIFQPEWSPDGRLYFVSDKSGWWNLYRVQPEGGVEPICPKEAEFALPQWIFGLSTYGFASENQIICAYCKKGIWHLGTIEIPGGELREIETNYTDISFLRAANGRAIFRAASPSEPASIVTFDLERNQFQVHRRAIEHEIKSGFISAPRLVEFPTTNGLDAYGFFYAPANSDFQAPKGERPPLLVKSHGGPTSATTAALTLSIQYWTSRGIAVLDVNYGGSSGYGREYRERLTGNWGIVDVDDCVNGANYLSGLGEVDGERLVIDGASAGGYTTLCALVFRNTFKAGASHFGVSDVEALAKETHKMESRYLDKLIGPYPARADLYRERSPIHFTDQLSCPVIFFQGLEDRVVPPNQAETMVAALKAKNIPVAYVAFPGEQHGFRQAKNIKRALEGELFFYAELFGFELADAVEPVEIVR